MLQVVNLTKIYKVKGGVETRALDGVTLAFPEKGMVFLLGKSGSGKSTLLNVCGGLDNPSGGEIIVKGKSSKSFTQSDFDSYRNTYVGFVFQEYNILNEFSVEDNIALALELQGKPKDKEEIASILKQVDLDGYAKRKPNTLSGGQKQRIAIARALIKNPEIIMADEPTGALDSNTGRQVLETLKKLSKDKLVIVVSHDREFAERYGDRIIELKDGKILSDVSKDLERKQTEGNVTVLGGKTLCVGDGDALTEEDFRFIRSFLKGQKGTLITSGEEEINNFKRVNRITDEGEREVFVQTDESKQPKKTYTSADGKFIRSRLPLRRAAKIGVSSLKTKPIRLIFTILLSVVSFTMFGLFSTLMLYDDKATLYNSMRDGDMQYLVAKKEYNLREHTIYNGEEERIWTLISDGKLNQTDVDKYKKDFGEGAFGAVRVRSGGIGNIGSSGNEGQLWQNPSVSYLAALPAGNPLRNTFLAGSYPVADNEIAVSEYVAQCLVKSGYASGEEKPNSVEEVVGGSIHLRLGIRDGETERTAYKITGVFACDYQGLVEKYPNLTKTGSNVDREKMFAELQDFQTKYEENLYGVIFVGDKLQADYLSMPSEEMWIDPLASLFNRATEITFSQEERWKGANYNDIAKLNSELAVVGKREIAADEIVVSSAFLEYYMNYHEAKISEQQQEIERLLRINLSAKLNEYLLETGYYPTYESSIPDEQDQTMYKIYNDCIGFDWENMVGYFMRGRELSPVEWGYLFYENVFKPVWTAGENSYQTQYNGLKSIREEVVKIDGKENTVYRWLGGYEGVPVYDDITGDEIVMDGEMKEKVLAGLLQKFQEYPVNCWVTVQRSGGGGTVGDMRAFRIAGIVDCASSDTNIILVNSDAYEEMYSLSKQYGTAADVVTWYETNYKEGADSVYDIAFFPYDHSDGQTKAIKNFSYTFGEEDSRIILSNALAQDVQFINSMVEEMSKMFMWIGIVVLAFSALLLSNFISVSIANKKKEIGILRAVGARGIDVFKIFFTESLTIGLICSIISLVISVLTCGVLNGELGQMLSGVTLFVFGPISVAILLGVAILTAAIATFLPVYFAARKKPVESIRAL